MSQTSTLQSLISTPGFLALSAFRLCRSISTWIELTVIYAVMVLYFEASTAEIAVTAVWVSVPHLILTPIAGAFCDRHSPVLVMRVSALCRVVVAICMSMASTLPVFVVLMFIRSVALLGEVAEPVVNRRLLAGHKLLPAAQVAVTIEQGTKLLAPVIGSTVASMAFAQSGFLIAACFCGLCVVSSVFLGSVARNWVSASTVSTKSTLLTGMRLTLTTKGALFNVCMIYASLCFSVGSLNPLLLILLRDNNLSRSMMGTLMLSMSIGAMLGSMSFKILFRHASLVNVLIGSQLALCAVVACSGLLSNFFYPYPVWLLFTLYGMTGFLFASASVAIFAIIQTTAPVESIGAVSAVAKGLFFFFTLVAPMLSTLVAQTIDAYAGLFITGLIGILIGAVTSLRTVD